jgi:dTDP-4-dehydrorhamnose reductase
MYGISKLAGEFSALQYCQKSIVIRSAYIYGGQSGSRSKKGNFVLTMLKQTDGKDSLEVSSEQIVSPTYAADLAKATFQLLKVKSSKGAYHLVNSGKCSLAEFTEEIVKIKKRNTKIIPVDRGGMAGSLHRPTYSALKNTRAKESGVTLPAWKDALKRYINSLT